jgi:predicted alpha/beta-hydrolase family hydrolase
MLPDYLVDGPTSAPLTFAFTHGAGAPMDSDWMNTVTSQIALGGYRVVRFEFPYMAESCWKPGVL